MSDLPAHKSSQTQSTSIGKYQPLYADIRQLIAEARSTVIQQVNQILTVTYLQIGKRVSLEILQSRRANYGEATIKRLAENLKTDFGKGFGYRNLMRMVRFYEQFTDEKTVTTLSANLIS